MMGRPVHWDTFFMDKAKERCPTAWAQALGFDWHNNGLYRGILTHSNRMRSILYWDRCPLMWCCDDDSPNHVGVVVRRFATETGKLYCHTYDYHSFHPGTSPTLLDGSINKAYVQKLFILKTVINKMDKLMHEQRQHLMSTGHTKVIYNDTRLVFYQKPGKSKGFRRILDYIVRISTEQTGNFEGIM